ncbi:Re/Si-specific NAD(P)(+) transhydrogenase subunit alpha [Methylomagnum ishizawai]|uniref:Re/Si-specific NAD(P)(+) transhydrogenase subunit alpha n=1 Tax=Methylomagnum ishizawai TaxID=1760988 RepID=UPI001C333900|nr:Re/Si-specific NAD(P)(+) transhydrogenase subunit alpha [Methylomagnum ishizawai]BBL76708.1 NAD(P) transhydrogenase subunit alpha [Methylomagnum ishizawai]
MRIGVPKEIHAGEKRVATVPEVAEKLIKLGFSITVESGAGVGANFSDECYREAGCEIADSADAVWGESDVVLKVRGPQPAEVEKLKAGGHLVSFLWPAQNPELLESLAAKQATVLAMDAVPRISRAQKLDALSSMANIAGYRAVVEAAHQFGRFFTGQITAAGKVPPAKVFVIGVGVAGLAAIGAANGLGAIVRACDTRPEVKDQVKSMGAEWVEPDYKEDEGASATGYAKIMSEAYQKAQREMIARQCMDVDIVITTALIPGKPAPKLITAGMVESMKPGSVIVDLAAEQGGNCELCEPGQIAVKHGVSIIGYTDLPSRLARQSSTLYATNLLRLLEELCKEKDGNVSVNMDDEMIRGATVVKDGSITWPPPPISVSAAPKVGATAAPPVAKKEEKKPLLPAWASTTLNVGLAALVFWWVGANAPASFLSHFTVFALACFVGYMVIWNVTPALHTPLMSVTNAISSIIAIGALIQVSSPGAFILILAGLAIVLTSINMAGGFWVTQRMLSMFRK